MSKINGYDDKNKRVVVDIIARHWNIFRDLLMLADITNVSRDIVNLAHNCAILRLVHSLLIRSESSVKCREQRRIDRIDLLTNIINIRQEMLHQSLLSKEVEASILRMM